MDYWQFFSTIAALFFTLGFIDQCRMTYKTRSVEGLSLLQWVAFTAASAIFVGYYAHLHQWAMVVVSILGTFCCLALVVMIVRFDSRAGCNDS